MKGQEFTTQEIQTLCRLYSQGLLSRKEENLLNKILPLHLDSQEAVSTLEMMETEKLIFSKRKKKLSRIRIYSSVAAAVLIICGITIPLAVKHSTPDETFVVWQNGEKITGEEARKIAEENQQVDMEMIRQLMRQQREMMKRNFASLNDDFDF